MSALLSALMLLAMQDESALETLILQLDDEDIRSREEAVLELSTHGEQALDALRPVLAQSSLESRLRAQDAVDRIQRELRIRKVLTEPELVDLRGKEQPLEDLVLELGRRSRLSLSLRAGLGRRSVTMTRGPMTPLEALDVLCAQSGCDWSYVSPHIVEIRDGRRGAGPASYSGRFRFTLPHLERLRSICGDIPSDTICLRVEADHEHGIAPVVPPVIVIEKVVDDRGNVLAPQSEIPAWVTVPFHPDEELADPEHAFRSSPLLVPGFAPGAQRLASVSGYALYEFALAEAIVDVPQIDTMAWVQRNALEIGVFAPLPGTVEIRIQSADGTALARGALNVAGIRIIDCDGKEHRASFRAMAITDHSTPEASCLHYLILFDEYGRSEARSVRLPLVTERYEKKVPFSFTDIPLP